MRIVRQGDVLLLEVLKLPADCAQIGAGSRIILANGEATGHAHELVVADPGGQNNIPARLYEEPSGPDGEAGRFLFVERACVLTHQEHGAIPIRPGFYKVIRQREYLPPPARSVRRKYSPEFAPDSRYIRD
jgi:hypothetical protein